VISQSLYHRVIGTGRSINRIENRAHNGTHRRVYVLVVVAIRDLPAKLCGHVLTADDAPCLGDVYRLVEVSTDDTDAGHDLLNRLCTDRSCEVVPIGCGRSDQGGDAVKRVLGRCVGKTVLVTDCFSEASDGLAFPAIQETVR
jgi:hypothetical protein